MNKQFILNESTSVDFCKSMCQNFRNKDREALKFDVKLMD